MKAIKKINPISGVFSTIEALTGQIQQNRDDRFNDEIDNINIDTVCAFDTNTWETGIKRGEWIIVEQYITRELAEIGHKKWVAKIKKNPKIELRDINLWDLE